MEFKKNDNTRISVTFGSTNGRLLPARVKLDAIADMRTPDIKIRSGYNPLHVWRTERGYSVGEIAQAIGVKPARYMEFEKGLYRGLQEEHLEKFCNFLSVHPAGLIQTCEPINDALMNVLIKCLRSNDIHSQQHELSVLALQAEVDEAQYAMVQAREYIHKRGHYVLVGPFLDLLQNSFSLGRAGPMDPEDLAEIYMDDVIARKRALEKQATKPAFLNDEIWRTYSDAVLRLYGPNTPITKNIEQLRNPFRRYAWEWDILTKMVKRDPEVLHPLLWQDDMGAQFIGGKLMSREQTVDAMMSAYRAYQQRDVSVEAAKGELFSFRSQVNRLESWMNKNTTQRLFAYWRNRQVAQGVLGVSADGMTRISGILPPPTPKIA